MTTKLNNLSQKYFKAKGEDRQEISMITTMVRKIIKIDISQIMEIGEYCLVAEYNMDRTTETEQSIIRIKEMTSGGNLRGNIQLNQNYRGQNYRGGYGRNYRNDNYERGRSRSWEREYSEVEGTTEVTVGLDKFKSQYKQR